MEKKKIQPNFKFKNEEKYILTHINNSLQNTNQTEC